MATSALEQLASNMKQLGAFLDGLVPGDDFWPTDGSPADDDLRKARPRRTVGEAQRTAVSQGSLLYIAMTDHLDSATRLLPDTTLMGSAVLARVGVDAAATLFWLAEPGLKADRPARAYALRERLLIHNVQASTEVGSKADIAHASEALERFRGDVRAAKVPTGRKGGVSPGVPQSQELIEAVLAAKSIRFGRVWFMRTSELLHSNPGVMFSEFQGDVSLKPKRQGGETQLTLSASQVAMHVGLQLFATWAATERLADWFGWPSEDLDEHFGSCMEPIRPVWEAW